MLFTLMSFYSFFFFNDTATTEIYTLSLHDALPICLSAGVGLPECYTFPHFPTLFDSRQRRLDGRRREATHAGGKSGLRRAGCWLTARGGNPTDQCHRKQTAVSETGR